jgi:hypothetical protein
LEDNSKTDLEKQDVKVWSEIKWLKIGFSSGAL